MKRKKTIRNAVMPILMSSDLSENLCTNFSANQPKHLGLSTYNSSYVHLLASNIFKNNQQSILLIFNDKQEALYALNELQNWFSKKKVLFFPATYLNPYQFEETQNANIVLRTEVLKKLQSEEPTILVSYTQAISEKLTNAKSFKEKSFQLKVGDLLEDNFLNNLLFQYHFKRVDYVTEPGEFSIRGSIIDVFSFSDEKPIRINFFGDEIEKLKYFDISSQLSIKEIDGFTLIPNLDDVELNTDKVSLIQLMPKNAIVILKESDRILHSINKKFNKAIEIFNSQKTTITQKEPSLLYCSKESFWEDLRNYNTLEYAQQKPLYQEFEPIVLSVQPQPQFHKNFDLLAQNLESYMKQGFTAYINCNSDKQAERLKDIFEETGHSIPFKPSFSYIHEGFIDTENQLLLYTDHQIFDRYQSHQNPNRFSKSEALTLAELTQLRIGDYVTHIDHGVGKFLGLKKLNNNGKIQEAIKLSYLNNDLLYVNIHSLHKITKHSGQGNAEPKIDKLGSKSWANRKNKTKTKVKELAFDLIQLYAKRKENRGFEFEPDSYLQNELEASFLYEDTPDQEKATMEVKQDMQSAKIMDRLICGDVGFGKTEVAIRAAFKAVLSGKQVAILVPTTILAYQHFNTFTKRLEEFPVTIDYLNRFRSTQQKNNILERLSSGKIDIVIGTHQLVNKKIKFKDLGLLIIDEEHKFGVSVKDKLKTFKTNVDTLTLTATPIPRTLQFSLMAARDMSVIKTPPPNRQPVHTQRISFNEEIMRDAILMELQREGQVFIINNRIENLEELSGMVQRLVPEARIITGHGRMEGKTLEKNLMDFIQHKKDVLIATSIIESGLDIPNANTIIINNAHQFGLADLHQMRGRVGRSNKKAYCYLVAPNNESLTDEARKRLNAVETFSDLGSGFHIALKDLEIRGAGDILGPEQSGFISDIGFDAYQKIMNEAVQELKQGEFKDLFEGEDSMESIAEVQIDTDLEILIPDDYINDVEVRLQTYQRMANLENGKEIIEMRHELIDRFGSLPKSVEDLLLSVQLKQKAQELGIKRLVLKNKALLCYLPNEKDPFYEEGGGFQHILDIVQSNPSIISLKNKKTAEDQQLIMRVENMERLQDVMQILTMNSFENQKS